MGVTEGHHYLAERSPSKLGSKSQIIPFSNFSYSQFANLNPVVVGNVVKAAIFMLT